ncbi:hypothetical protein FC650_20555 [Vibrio natriegens]|uniref:hypothetical protein n=1 Tax=Vibrio natriegens TaxID=691 RepID=UPI001593DC6F|nr:hypothetical protein [Vibrio natriegens]NVC95952.1 hypothetical protein [Vibrio natriegens]
MFNYIEAIEQCKSGNAVRCVNWTAERCIMFVPSGTHAWLKLDYIAEAEILDLPLENGTTMRAPSVKTNPDTTYVIYMASESDMESNWESVSY